MTACNKQIVGNSHTFFYNIYSSWLRVWSLW